MLTFLFILLISVILLIPMIIVVLTYYHHLLTYNFNNLFIENSKYFSMRTTIGNNFLDFRIIIHISTNLDSYEQYYKHEFLTLYGAKKFFKKYNTDEKMFMYLYNKKLLSLQYLPDELINVIKKNKRKEKLNAINNNAFYTFFN